jgi:hypothetical protein
VWFKRLPDGFPKGFKAQRIGIEAAMKVADLFPIDIANYFRDHPDVATRLLHESYDKRYTPSTYITEEGDGFSVGWLSRSPVERKCKRNFSTLADAATDYLLFSLGRGRWNPP